MIMDEQQLQQQIVQLVQAAMQGDQQATQLIQQIMQAAQQGDQQAAQLAQMIQQVAQQLQQQQVQAAKFGAKLNYIKQLRGVCPEGYEMQYFKAGGQLCKQCVAKQKKMEEGGKAPSNPVDAFKCGRKMKKKACGGTVKEAKCGTKIEMDKCGKKMKKKACGGSVEKNLQGGSVTSVKHSGFLPRTTIFRTIEYPKEYEAGVPDTIYLKTVSYGLPFTTDIRLTGKVRHDRTGYYNIGGGRTEALTHKVSPSGRAVSGLYNQLRNEYNKMK